MTEASSVVAVDRNLGVDSIVLLLREFDDDNVSWVRLG